MNDHYVVMNIIFMYSQYVSPSLFRLVYPIVHLFQVLLVSIVLLAAFGNKGLRLTFGVEDFLGVGVSFGLAIIVPLILLSYLLGGSLFAMVRCSESSKVLG